MEHTGFGLSRHPLAAFWEAQLPLWFRSEGIGRASLGEPACFLECPRDEDSTAGAWQGHSLTPVLLRVQSPWRGTNRPRNIWATQAGTAPPCSRAQAQARWCVGWGWGLGNSGAHLAPRGEQSWHQAGQLPLSARHPPCPCFLLQPCRQTANPNVPMGKLRLREARSLGQSETSRKWWTDLNLETCVCSFCYRTLSAA